MRAMVMRAAIVALPIALAAVDVGAQQTTPRRPRRTTAIEIRGQVPTPQVVTVRPREVPAYSRRVLVPNFYDHDFWPAILPGYQLVPQRMVTGNTRLDSLSKQIEADSVRSRMPIDSSGRSGLPAGFAAPRTMTPMLPAGTDTTRRAMPPAMGDSTRRTMPVMPSDTTRRPPGTPPARSTR